MTRTDWKPGDKAFYVRDLGAGVDEVTIRSEPWQLGDGSWLVAFEGKSGGYALERFHTTREEADKAAKKAALAWAKRRGKVAR